MKPHITVVGSSNVDFIMQVPHLPDIGETVTDGNFVQTFGGKGANQAVAAARAGGDVTFVTALGNDVYVQQQLDNFQADDISTEYIAIEPDIPSGIALVIFDQKGDNYLTVAPGSNYRMTPERIQRIERVIARSDWIILQQEIPVAANRAVLELAAKYEQPVLLNYAPAIDLTLQPDANVHGLVVNEVEAAALVGKSFDSENIEATIELASQLRKKGEHRFVIITLGDKGAVFAKKLETGHILAHKCQAIDTTAAGDTFCGALAVALGEGKVLTDAIWFASAASALAVCKVGAQPSIPQREAINTCLKEMIQ